MTRRIGILGGTFDPIHCGHIDLGTAAQKALNLTSLVIIPANIPPHRRRPIASGFHRFAMVALAIGGRSGWRASDLELSSDTPSYTATTLQRLREQGYAAPELFFVIGADAFAEIDSWKHYPEILEETHFAVVSRPGWAVADLRDRLPGLAERMFDAAPTNHPSRPASIFLIDAPTADVSSTGIRERRMASMSISGLVPAGVEQHIEQHGLYAPNDSEHGESGQLVKPTAGRLHGQS